jgi:hypothetical protein
MSVYLGDKKVEVTVAKIGVELAIIDIIDREAVFDLPGSREVH